jgi:hypothetical protein
MSREPQALLACAQLLLDRHLRGEIDVLENHMRYFPIAAANGKEMSLRPE